MAADSDEAATLMRRYCAGDRAAFSTLYRLTAPRLLHYLIGLLGDRAAAEDVLQQTFIKIHEARSAYVLDADPLPWFYTIAHRTCLDELRRRKRARVHVTSDGEIPNVAAEPETEPESSTPALYNITLAALDQLPANQRSALLLTKVEGKSHAEAAAILGTSVGAIKLRAHRAYEALRKHFSRRGGAGADDE